MPEGDGPSKRFNKILSVDGDGEKDSKSRFAAFFRTTIIALPPIVQSNCKSTRFYLDYSSHSKTVDYMRLLFLLRQGHWRQMERLPRALVERQSEGSGLFVHFQTHLLILV